jgi:acyl dehydratase
VLPLGAVRPAADLGLDSASDVEVQVGVHRFLQGRKDFDVDGRRSAFPRPSRDLPRHAGGMDETPRVGDEARRTRTVTGRDIELFTEISGDRNPLHYDAEVAAASRFGGLVVQGGVTSGLLNAVVAEDLPGPGSVFLEVSWRFLAPVRPGDEITASVTVTAVREDKPVTTLDTRIVNQDGTIVLDGTAVVWRDPVVAARSPRHRS